MNYLMVWNILIIAYIDNIFIDSNRNVQDYLNEVKLKKLKAAGFKINVEKSFFPKDSLEYLGFKITRQGIMPLPDKTQAFKHRAVPTNKKQLINFIGGE